MKVARILFGALVLGLVFNLPSPADDGGPPKSVTIGRQNAVTSESPAAATTPESTVTSGLPRATVGAQPGITPRNEDKLQIRVFELKYVTADDAAKMLKDLQFGGHFITDKRTNSLIAQDQKVILAQMETFLKAIDRPSDISRGAASAWTEPSNQNHVPATVASPRHRDTSAAAAPDDVRRLRIAFQQCDLQAAHVAAQLRDAQRRFVNHGQGNPQVLEMRRKLRDLVTAAYNARGQLEMAEVHRLRERLSRIERQLENNARLKDQVIDRRVEELLNPGLIWDAGFGETTERTNNQTAPANDVASLQKESENRNKLKQLALAMHDFHDTYGRFPKAVSTARDFGRKSDTPHSWRIDLLPFLGAADVYQQYKMDEPWDSPNNKKLQDRMPAVFRSPYDDPKSMSTAYAVLAGTGTIFEPGRQGVNIAEVTDGTSNTILVVEARRNCPWMKPEDIPFDADKPVPELGGFVDDKFGAVMADGRACVFKRSKVEDILKWMIIRNDGTPIHIPFDE